MLAKAICFTSTKPGVFYQKMRMNANHYRVITGPMPFLQDGFPKEHRSYSESEVEKFNRKVAAKANQQYLERKSSPLSLMAGREQPKSQGCLTCLSPYQGSMGQHLTSASHLANLSANADLYDQIDQVIESLNHQRQGIVIRDFQPMTVKWGFQRKMSDSSISDDLEEPM
jgi:Lon protease-like protein